MSKTILIGGGSGMIGTEITKILKAQGHEVRHLGRKSRKEPVPTFQWDTEKMTIDERAFEGVDVVINLAGTNISDHRWTDDFKKVLLESRTKSTQLIVDFLRKKSHSVRHFVAGSAIGYYGFGDSGTLFKEGDRPGTDFMSQLVVAWEAVADQLKMPDIALTHVRTGIVFGEHGGALEEMKKPIKFLVGSPLGSGKQYVSWIHIDDISRLFVHVIDNKLAGTFNGTAPEPATNEAITKGIAKRLHKPLWLPNVPEFALKIVLGEMTDAVVNGSKVSSEKIQKTGFVFNYPTLDKALDNVI